MLNVLIFGLKIHWDLSTSKSCPRLVLQNAWQDQHKPPWNGWAIILTWPQKSDSLDCQVCNDFMVLARIAGTKAAFPLVMYLRDLPLRGIFQRRIANVMPSPDGISNSPSYVKSHAMSVRLSDFFMERLLLYFAAVITVEAY